MILLAGALDYAGLFPPASQEMADAVRSYARYRQGPHRALLGRFVVPSARLDELWTEARELLPLDPHGGWDLSVLGGADPKEDGQHIADVEARHAGGRSVYVRSIERKVDGADEIRSVAGAYHDAGGRSLYLEIPTEASALGDSLAALAASGAYAKLRTGAPAAAGFPTPDAVARFVLACSAAGVPFKATAGLHHAVRGEYRLDYTATSLCATMHGFLNLFVGAALLDARRIGEDELGAVLEEPERAAFELKGGGARWRNRQVGPDEIRRARARLLHSFGTCSFEEPVAELLAMGALQ